MSKRNINACKLTVLIEWPIRIRTDIGSAEADLDVIIVTTANNVYKYWGNSKYVPFQTLQIA